jgi:hypothetical protein
MAQSVSVVLNAGEREQLAAIVADRNRPRKHVARARIVLTSVDRSAARGAKPRVQPAGGVALATALCRGGIEGMLRNKTPNRHRAACG